MASPKTLPNELLHKIVDILVTEGLHGTAVSLARTDKTLKARVLPRIYRSVFENETFFLAHWAAEHGQISTLKRAIEAGADVNEPWTAYVPACETWGPGCEQKYRRLSTAALDGKNLHQAIKQRCGLMWAPYSEQWYRRKEKGYEEIDEAQMRLLVEYYKALDEEGNRIGPIDQFAEALETKRMFLDAFAYWATPLHIAIREGKDDIIEALIENKKLDLNSSTYGNCACCRDWNWRPSICAISALHQALCQAKGFYIPQLIRLGTSYLSLSKTMLNATVDTVLVKPVLATPQPRNLLHETLSEKHPVFWQTDGWSGWCMRKYCRGEPKEWIVNLLLDNGYEGRLNERDSNNQLAVEIACADYPDLAVINTLLQRGSSQYDSLISVTFRCGNASDTGSILIWAIARNHLHLAEYLLTHDSMQPLFDISAPSDHFGYTALHILCARPYWPDRDPPGSLPKKILQKLLTKIEVDKVSGGHTPLTYALKWLVECPGPDTSPLQLVSTLLEHGADILNENQTCQKTPLEIFFEHIADSEYYSQTPHGKVQDDCPLCNPEKQSSLLRAIAKIRLYDCRTGNTDGLDDIFQMLRDPVDLAWVPQALKKLRRPLSARVLDNIKS